MKFNSSLILIIALLGCTLSQQISIPLKQKNNGFLFMTVEYGLNKCSIDVIPGLACTNTIIAEKDVIQACGAEFVSDQIEDKYQNFQAVFSLGGTTGVLEFDNGGHYVYSTSLCFGILGQGGYKSAITELLLENKISEQIVYFNINPKPANIENPVVGSLDIGLPNLSLINYGKFTRLPSIQKSNGPYTNEITGFSIFGKDLSGAFLRINPLKSGLYMNSFAYSDILSSFDKHGIFYVRKPHGFFNDQIIFNSLKGLKPLLISVKTKNDSEYQISISPSQYTIKISNGFLLDIDYQDYYDFVDVGFSIFTSYYIGYDAATSDVLIAEKVQQQSSNFRRIQN